MAFNTLNGEGNWYFKIVGSSGVFSKYPAEEIVYPWILVAYDFPDEVVRPPTVTKGFRVFKSPEKLYRFISRIDKSSRHFFEYIFGERRRHAFLDIDLKVGEESVFTVENLSYHADFLRHDIVNILNSLSIPLENFRWYSSNREDKRSYHLIILGYYLENCHESKRLIKYIHQRIHKIYHKPVDISVSKKLQAFRILGSCKKGDERPKILEREWSFYGEKIVVDPKSEYEEFLESLCCRVDENDVPFPQFELEDDEDDDRGERKMIAQDDVDQEIFDEINTEILKIIGDNFDDPILKDNLIAYNRITPSYCPICTVNSDYNDVHEKGGMFAVISQVDGGYNVYLHCFQSERHIKKREKRYLFIGFFSTGPKFWIGKPEHMDLQPLPPLQTNIEGPVINESDADVDGDVDIVTTFHDKVKIARTRNKQVIKDDEPDVKVKAHHIKDAPLIKRNKKMLKNRSGLYIGTRGGLDNITEF